MRQQGYDFTAIYVILKFNRSIHEKDNLNSNLLSLTISSTRNNSRNLSTSSVEESVQMIKSEVIPCLQNAMQTLQNIWSEIGLQEDQKEERTRSVLVHLRNLLQEMVSEEEELKATLQANVETCSQELEKLSQELGLPVQKVSIL